MAAFEETCEYAVGDDTLEVALARANMRTLLNRTALRTLVQRLVFDVPVVDSRYQTTVADVEPVPEMTTIDDIPKACAATAADDDLEVKLAFADMIDVQARADAANDIMEQQLWAAGLPRAFEDAVEKDKLESVLAQNRKDMEQEHV